MSRTALQVRVPVDCPLCGLDVLVLAVDFEPAVQLPPVDVGGIVVYEVLPSRATAVVLTCSCVVPYPPWVLVFPSPGARPFFSRTIREHAADPG